MNDDEKVQMLQRLLNLSKRKADKATEPQLKQRYAECAEALEYAVNALIVCKAQGYVV